MKYWIVTYWGDDVGEFRATEMEVFTKEKIQGKITGVPANARDTKCKLKYIVSF